MHIGLNVYRLSSLKHYAGLVEHALREGIDVTLFCDYTETETLRVGGKAYEFPYTEKLPAFRNGRPRVEAYRSVEELKRGLQRSGVDVLFSLYAKPLLRALKREDLPGFYLAQVQAGWDYLIGGADLELFDAVYGFSEAWPGWWADYMVHLDEDIAVLKNYENKIFHYPQPPKSNGRELPMVGAHPALTACGDGGLEDL